jgi:hypothetical protein
LHLFLPVALRVELLLQTFFVQLHLLRLFQLFSQNVRIRIIDHVSIPAAASAKPLLLFFQRSIKRLERLLPGAPGAFDFLFSASV